MRAPGRDDFEPVEVGLASAAPPAMGLLQAAGATGIFGKAEAAQRFGCGAGVDEPAQLFLKRP